MPQHGDKMTQGQPCLTDIQEIEIVRALVATERGKLESELADADNKRTQSRDQSGADQQSALVGIDLDHDE